VIAGIVIVGLAYVNEKATSKILQAANLDAARNTNRLTGNMRNVEVIEAMGMTDALLQQQIADNNKVLALQSKASRKGAALSSTTRAFRIIMQSSMLCVGALLVLRQDISPGVMIAGSLLLGRALAPLDVLVATWKNFAVARSQFQRLEKLLQETPAIGEQMKLPAPSGKLHAEKLVVVPPGSKQVVLHHVELSLEPGESLGIVGPSAAGKTSLLRTLLGIWKPAQGCVRLDGVDVAVWNRAELGKWLGYLPQDIELFDGTVAQNICRFGHADPDQIVAAAKLADIHEMILSMPDGYDTVIGGNTGMLSGGQRQRIGLARAVYGEPRLLILDEPNSNLDDRGEQALVQTLKAMKPKGVTVVVATHRPSILFCMDKIMVMQEGRVLRTDSCQQIISSLKNQVGAYAQETGQGKGSVA
jgi:ATP-binding cassette subfamily C protein EexD